MTLSSDCHRDHTEDHRLIEVYQSRTVEGDLENTGGNRRLRIGCLACGNVWTQEYNDRLAVKLPRLARGDQARIAAAKMAR